MKEYCQYCGNKFIAPMSNARPCHVCNNVTYNNPLPVGIAVIRVVKDGREGILIVRRGHEPKRGEWALPGGHIECGEQIVDAIVRELREETGLVLAPDALEAWRAASNPAGTHILIFATLVAAAPIPFENVAFTPSDEVLEVGVMYDKDFPLAYPLHQEAAQREFIWILE